MKTKRKLITSPRLFLLGIFGCVLIFALWFLTRSFLAKNLTQAIDMAEKKGYQIGHGGIVITGFPFSMRLASDNISVAAPPGPKNDVGKNWAVKLGQVRTSSANLNPTSWQLTHRGTARVDMHGLNSARYMFDISPAHINANIAVHLTGALKAAHFDMSASQINTLVGSPPILIAFDNIKADFTTQALDGHLAVSGKNLSISENQLGPLAQVLGRDLSQFTFETMITNWRELEKNGNTNWQDNNGRIISKNVALKWGQLDAIVDFDIGFKDGNPDGKIYLKIKDTPTLFANLSKSGLINPTISAQAGLFLGGLKKDDEGRQNIELTLKDGQLKYGFIPLYRF